MDLHEQYQQQYQDAGITGMIAQRAASARTRQESGDPLDEIETQILDYANRGLSQQQELESLNQQPGQEARRIGLTSLLYQSGIEPHTDEETKQQSQGAIATGDIPGLNTQEREFQQQQESLADTPLVDPREEPEQTTLTHTRVEPNITLQSDGEQDDDSSDTRTDELLEQAGKLLDNAGEAGITESNAGMETLYGANLNVSRLGKTIIISGKEEEKQMVGEGNQVFTSYGITDRDREAISKLSELEPDELLQRTEQRQLELNQERSQQREAQREQTPNLSL